MKEQAVLASFRDPESAKACEKELRSMGVEETQIDRVDAFPGDSTDRLTNFITGKIPSLASVTLGTSFGSQDASVMAAAHPDASGMARGSDGFLSDVTGFDILLTAVCDASQTEQVVQTIKKHGGRT